MNSKLPRDFWLYRLGQLTSALGGTCGQIALAWWVLDVSGSAWVMSSVLATFLFSHYLALICIGPLADRFDLKKMAIVGDTIRLSVWVGLGVIAWNSWFSLPALITLLIVDGVGGAVFGSTVMNIIPRLVDRSKLDDAFSKVHALDAIGGVCGGVAGGFIVTMFGPATSFFINALSFLVSAIAIYFIRLAARTKAKRPLLDDQPDSNSLNRWYRDLVDGFAFVFGNKLLLIIVLVFSAFAFFITFRGVGFAVWAKAEGAAWVLGALRAAFAAGTIGGALLNPLFLKITSRSTLCVGAIVLAGVSFLVFNSDLSTPFVIFSALGLGLSVSTLAVIVQSKLSRAIPEHIRARVFTQIGCLEGMSEPVGLALAGAGIEWIGIKNSAVVVAVGLFAVAAFLLLRRDAVLFLDDQREDLSDHYFDSAGAGKSRLKAEETDGLHG